MMSMRDKTSKQLEFILDSDQLDLEKFQIFNVQIYFI